MMRTLVWRWHQWLGILTCVGLLLWGLSGVMHPIMSRLQPKPVQFMPPKRSVELRQALPLVTVLRHQHIEKIEQVGLAMIQGQSYYRVQPVSTSSTYQSATPARYFSTRDGREWREGDRFHAEQLARHYTGLSAAPIESIRFVSSFDSDYDAVNKLLPVWRVAFKSPDGLIAYIDTDQARLATLSDTTKRQLSTAFRFAHTWTFLDGMPYVQVTTMSVVLFCALFSALSGIYFYGVFRSSASQRLRHRPLSRWHRRVGIIVSIATLSSVTSGTFHLLHGFQREKLAPAFQSNVAVSALEGKGWMNIIKQPLSRLSLVTHNGHSFWMGTPASTIAYSGPRAQVANLAVPEQDEHAHHHASLSLAKKEKLSLVVSVIDTIDGTALPGGIETIARQLAVQYAKQPYSDIQSVELITKFGNEYGFFNKRLPVYKVQFNGVGHPRYYIEPATGVLAARIDDSDALEGKSFSYLHKWHFTEAGKDLRDILLALFAVGNVIVACMGLVLFIRLQRS